MRPTPVAAGLLILAGLGAVSAAPPRPTASEQDPHAWVPPAAPVHWSFVPPRRPAVPPVPEVWKYGRTDVRTKGSRVRPRSSARPHVHTSTLPHSPKGWVRNPIDAFILDRLQRSGLTPSPPADRATLLRRVSFDLTGLPPDPEEIAGFLADHAPDAYEKVVDRLLASSRYGERWAQHWLDVVRFAETNGYELDADRPQAWRYRDYVVRSLNADKPYDRFLQEQIAGDALDADDFELRVATGFLRAGPQHVVGGNVDEKADRQEWLTEAVNGVGSAVMGLTIGCARCHDHKFDPIPQADYYRLQAFLAATRNEEFKQPKPGDVAALEAAGKAHKEQLQPVQSEIAAIEKPYRERLRAAKQAKLEPKYAEALRVEAAKRTPEQRRLAQEAQVMLNVAWDELVAALEPADRDRRAGLRKQLHTLELQAPEPTPVALSVADSLSPVPPVHVLAMGDPHAPREEVEPGFPAVLRLSGPTLALAVAAPAPGKETASRRLALAQWLTRPDHPLTARVMVNRLWQHHFGRGLVATPNDFGRHGARPTHPDLLDWLSVRFAEGSDGAGALQGSEWWSGGKQALEPRSVQHSNTPILQYSAAPPARPWSLKALHRLMVTSATYRQRMNGRRLEAEALRDAVLAAAGTLTEQPGGPPVRVPLEPEVYDTIFTEAEPDNLWPVTLDPRQHTRRSLYLLRKRNVRLPLLAVFDQPDMMTACGAREQSVHALQSLTLMNSDFMVTQSRALAGRLWREGTGGSGQESAVRGQGSGGADEGRIGRLYLLTLGRPATAKERGATERFLAAQAALLRARLARGESIPRVENVPEATDPAVAAAWADLCLAMLNLNEFVYER